MLFVPIMLLPPSPGARGARLTAPFMQGPPSQWRVQQLTEQQQTDPQMAMQPPPMQKHHHHHHHQQHQQSREPLHRRLLQSGSVRTWQGSAHDDQADVSIGTAGRPLDAEVELWEGPGHTPVKTRVWSEDGRARPFRGMVHPGGREHSVAVRNHGRLEPALRADGMHPLPTLNRSLL